MKLEINNIYHGFKLLEEKNIKEINSITRLFRHEKSGARLFHIENNDDNKVFSISFRTPPEDSTGVPHILEHSVLCGSRKFPIKEPFVELAKGSLNTFLNAMTFPDKTMYPVASRNLKDFRNLMDVYLDAVLYPNIYKYPEIMMQEGWHYELDNKDSELTYKGVVYNEMKGAFSSPESILMRKVQEALFPDTPYGVESGGDPDIIPELTQEQFVNFHKKYYHPANSYIFLYGDMDLLDTLNFIDTEYLNNFETMKIASEIPMQTSFKEEKSLVVPYPISPNEKSEDKAYLSLSFVIGKSTDAEIYLAFDILEHLLLETPASPLKRALIEANLGKDVFGSFESSILQPAFSIVVKNSNEGKVQEFKDVVFNTLNDLVKCGINKDLIQSSINIKEFKLREADFDGYPTGLLYGIKCMDSWLYGEDPTLHLEYDKILKKIKASMDKGYFEKLIANYLINNDHKAVIIVKPQKGLAEEKANELTKKLADYKSTLSATELNKLISQTEKLIERQNTQDTPEALKSIPLLTLKDIEPKIEKLSISEKTEKEARILIHPIFTSGIVYINLYFDSKVVPQKNIPYITLLSGMLGRISTEKHSFENLSNLINLHTGGIRYSGEAYSECGRDDLFYPKFVVRSKALVSKIPELMDLLGEILGSSLFDDKKRLKEIVQEMKSRIEMRINERGHVVAAKRACSYFSPISKYEDILNGLDFYKFICEIENKLDEAAENLKETARLIFRRNTLIMSFTGEEKDYSFFQQNLPKLFDNLKNDNQIQQDYNFEFGPKNEGLMTASKVQYVAKAYNFKKLGYSHTGSLDVLKTIAGYDYLWNRIRVQGGAYGAFAKFEWGGNTMFMSYRDPNLKETLNAYDDMYKYIKDFDADEREMTKYIIGTISEHDYPLTPALKGIVSDEYYIRHITDEALQKERDEILNTNPQLIRDLSDLVFEVTKQNYLCVLGNEEKISSNKGVFENIANVFE